MNLYDTKVVNCGLCKKTIGEVDFDAMIPHPLCGQCKIQLPKEVNVFYTLNPYKNMIISHTA